MIGLKKKQPFTLKDSLHIDFALPLHREEQIEDIQKRLQALRSLGVQQVVFAMEPISVTEQDDKFAIPLSVDTLGTLDGIMVEAVSSYWLDETLEVFAKEHPLSAYRGKYVLLALRSWESIRGLKGPLFELRARGYEPVILHHDPKQYLRIKLNAAEYLNDLGCLLQLDLLTLTGVYGMQAKGKAEILVSKGWISMLTTGIRTAEDSAHLGEFMLTTSFIPALQQAIGQHFHHISVT